MKEQKYTLTVTESQLWLIADCVEDCHRFAAGQMELSSTTAFLDNRRTLRKALGSLQPLVTPDLEIGVEYSWDGASCKNDRQRKFIAQTYCIYREILHRMAELYDNRNEWNVYNHPTLTCDEGGPLPKVELIKEEENEND